jgi:hypothetical protein
MRIPVKGAAKGRAATRAETKSHNTIKFAARTTVCPNAVRCVMRKEAAYNIFALAVGALIPIALLIVVLIL